MRAWLSVVRLISGLLTILLVSLLQCVKIDILGTPCEEDLDRTHHHFIYFYITDKLCFYFLISFWYLHFFFLLINTLACNWELSLPLLFACHSKHLFCPFQHLCYQNSLRLKVTSRITTGLYLLPTYATMATKEPSQHPQSCMVPRPFRYPREWTGRPTSQRDNFTPLIIRTNNYT